MIWRCRHFNPSGKFKSLLKTLDQIINGCIIEDAISQRLFYDMYRNFAAKIVFRYIYRYEKTSDVVTDGFIKAFSHFGKFQKKEGDLEKLVMGWLKRIMINTAIDELRRNQMMPEIGGIPEDVWNYTDKTYDADQMLLYKDLVSVVKELPPNYRLVFNLYVLDGYSHSQIADLLHITVSTSRSSLTRAKTYLQEMIKNMEEEKYAGNES
jgi:RNA polymerase sigma factor (sigma-70 family)